MDSVNLILWIGATLLFIALFSGLEIAFISVSRLSIELKKKQGLSSGNILSKFMEQPSRFLGACLIGVNFFMVIYGLLFSELMRTSLWNPLKLQNEYVKLLFDTILSALVVLILGEFLPKAIFRARNDSGKIMNSAWGGPRSPCERGGPTRGLRFRTWSRTRTS